MKKILIISALLVGVTAVANTHNSKTADLNQKKNLAKEECLKENPSLQGAELEKCVQEKSKKVVK